MIVRDPVPLFPTFARLGALVALAAVTVWWVRKRRRQAASRRPASSRGELKRLPATVPSVSQSREGKRPPASTDSPEAQSGSRPSHEGRERSRTSTRESAARGVSRPVHPGKRRPRASTARA